jgi:hypothetical protein
MWILLTKKLPTEFSPPKLSIFWAEPWQDDRHAKQQKETCMNCGHTVWYNDTTWDGKKKKKRNALCECAGGPDLPNEDTTFIYTPFGKEANWVGAVKIIYRGTQLRVFPHEFSKLSDEHLNWYILGMPGENLPSHDLVSDLVPDPVFTVKDTEENPLQEIFDEAMKPIYDAAILDGATPAMAKMLSLGMDVAAPESTPIPLLGWYKCKEEYAKIYCEDREMEETYPEKEVKVDQVDISQT